MIKYYIVARVTKVEEVFNKTYVSGVGERAVFQEESKGWFVHFGGSHEKMNFGAEKPDFNVGDSVKITFEKQR